MVHVSEALGAIEVRERHGVTTDNGYVDVRDDGEQISVVVSGGGAVGKAPIRADQARYLARKLYRLARRADKRNVK